MYKVKIHGAGSIGNHLANASRRLGWSVDVCDIDAAALSRMKDSIYPGRYGGWDEQIRLFRSDEVPRGAYDMIFVGTPPDTHLQVALEAIKEEPRILLIEKPLCPPGLDDAQRLADAVADSGVKAFVGYDHVIGVAIEKVTELIQSGQFGAVDTIDVEFRERWDGIFAAHPWLDGPKESYLGFWSRGGGAIGEHSHAINLWQHLAHTVGAGRVVQVSAMADYISEDGASYDKIGALNLRTELGLVGRVVQDVVTFPHNKSGRVQGDNGHIEWWFGRTPGQDEVGWRIADEADAFVAEKTRPDDFIRELSHVEEFVDGRHGESPIALDRGLETALVIAAAHEAARNNRVVSIDYERGYSRDALR